MCKPKTTSELEEMKHPLAGGTLPSTSENVFVRSSVGHVLIDGTAESFRVYRQRTHATHIQQAHIYKHTRRHPVMHAIAHSGYPREIPGNRK